MLAFILYVTFLDSKRVLRLYFSLWCSLYFAFKLNLLNDFKKCPECYGSELCTYFENHQIQFTWFSCFLRIIHPNLTKSVFYGFFNDTEVVIKRKADRIEDMKNFNYDDSEVQNVVLCPSVKDSSFLFNQIEGEIESKRLWLNIRASIEPLLLKFFQSQGTWPFPKYIGACGDFIVEEYKGVPIANFLSSDFYKKASMAIQLLELANLFTFGHPELAFYFTDYSLDNLVIDSVGKIFLIDLDNVIISNKSALTGNTEIKSHTSEVFNDYKYAFSSSDICRHHLSDHNYFSVCKYLLSHPEEGLLKEIPKNVKKHEELLKLLKECTKPTVKSDRFSAGKDLQFLLGEIALGSRK